MLGKEIITVIFQTIIPFSRKYLSTSTRKIRNEIEYARYDMTACKAEWDNKTKRR